MRVMVVIGITVSLQVNKRLPQAFRAACRLGSPSDLPPLGSSPRHQSIVLLAFRPPAIWMMVSQDSEL